MDAASALNIVRSAFLSACFLGGTSLMAQDPNKAGDPQKARESNEEQREETQVLVGRTQPAPSIQTLAHWIGRWLTNPPAITTQFAVHEAVPILEMEAVIPCGHKICAGGKCYEVEEGDVDSKPCDVNEETPPTPRNEEPLAEEPFTEEPIIEAPAAPPLPPSYRFTRHSSYDPQEHHLHAAMESLDHSQVTLPASVLVSLLVDQARNQARLEMTQELLEERTSYLVKLQEMSEHNTRLQTQLAMIEMQHLANSMAGTPVPSPTAISEGPCVPVTGEPESTTELQAIHEDLSNIRKQIAILKSNQPVPFAPSYVGSESGTDSQAWPSPWRLSRPLPYVPISPWPKSQTQAAKPPETKVK